MKRFAFYILLTIMPLLAAGQGVLEGVVTDAKTGQPLEYVNVGIPGLTTGTTTNVKGFYRLSLQGDDSITVHFSYTGYETFRARVRRNQRTELDVALKPVATQLDEVTVSEDATRQTTFTGIDVQHLDKAVGPQGGVESVIKMLPDVQSNNELSSQYSVRGGSFDENLVYINNVEVFRPMLIRSGQQEGMSIINPDMVSSIRFSPGGFDATFGDKLSSVLGIAYSPGGDRTFGGKASVSLLGASATVYGHVGRRLDYNIGLRHHNNQYVLGSMDTRGSYTTSYTDLQAWLTYYVNNHLDLGLLVVATGNVYGLVPESRTTAFGSALQPGMEIDIYFDGQEQDRYQTLLGALKAHWRPSEEWTIEPTLSIQHINESERYDVQSQYWLYQIETGESTDDTTRFNRGVGTFLEHARNRLVTDIATFAVDAHRYARLGSWDMGVKLQLEQIDDHLREWKWVDSSGYTLPSIVLPFGDSCNVPLNPILQLYANSVSNMQTLRASAYLQRELNFHTRRGSDIMVLLGLRGQFYRSEVGGRKSEVTGSDITPTSNLLPPTWFVSPRASVSYKPRMEQDILFRLATGIYRQAPFYREYRRDDGSLCPDVAPQTAYQLTGTADWRFRLWDKSFTFTADLYGKYLTNLIPYTIDNLRLRYMPDQTAVGYVVGLSLRLNAELIEGLESWASLSLMQTQEDIEGDGLGWLARPTDQRFSFKLFLQDNVPDMPWWRMSLNLVYATGTPIAIPFGNYGGDQLRLPSYYRIDWGNTVRLSKFDRIGNWLFKHRIADVQVGLEVFNLFNFHNVVSYLWVADIDNLPRRVPNYLTARQLNLKITVLF
ncbi:MAG: carboxypeptidase-like regulatory domain-containing protein [Bacteroidales bacterium]|nr:carboxypeptidase-like regulatory domain-containing protein [Bacteroidales bacterium]